MPRTGISYQDVENAANELLNANKPVTNEQIRLKLGTGSSSTIARFLRQFKAASLSPVMPKAAINDLPASLLTLVKNLWHEMVADTQQEIRDFTQQHSAAFNTLTQQLQKSRVNNRRWQTLHEKWLRQKDQLVNEKLTLEQALNFKHRELTALLVKQENLFQQLTNKQTRIDELHQLHAQAQTNLEQLRKESQKQRKTIISLAQEKATLAGQLIQLEKSSKAKKKSPA